jgi:hypothetical protein
MRWQQSHTRAMIVAALSTIAVVGCGDDEKRSQDDAVRGTVGSWYAAVARGDGAKACALMTETGRKRDLTAGGGIVIEPSGSVRAAPATCEAQVRATGRELARTGLASEVNAAIVRDVRVLDERATVSAEFGERRQALVLRRVAGRWLVDGAPR